MKKTICIIICALLLAACCISSASTEATQRVSDKPIHFEGYVMGDFSGGNQNDWIGFDDNDPSQITVYDSSNVTYAAAYHNGFAYGFLYGYDGGGALHSEMYRIDVAKHSIEFVEGADAGGEFVYGMAYDPTSGTMYALCDEDHPYIASVDLETGALTRFVTVDLGSALGLQTFAIDSAGDFYALTFSALSSRLVRINKQTGALTVVFDTGMPCFYGQSMTYEPSTGCIYWAHVNEPSSLSNGLYKLDISAHTVEYVGMIGGGMEIMGLFTYDPDSLGAHPGDVDLNGTVDAADALLALRYAMGLIELSGQSVINGDIDGSGTIESADAVSILRYVMELIPSL